jgi:hypothetical protein
MNCVVVELAGRVKGSHLVQGIRIVSRDRHGSGGNCACDLRYDTPDVGNVLRVYGLLISVWN